MKCPWRPITKSEPFYARPGETKWTDFAECYRDECPFYNPEFRTPGGLVALESCGRIKTEVPKDDST